MPLNLAHLVEQLATLTGPNDYSSKLVKMMCGLGKSKDQQDCAASANGFNWEDIRADQGNIGRLIW